MKSQEQLIHIRSGKKFGKYVYLLKFRFLVGGFYMG
jgi:hypothetical protein